MACTQVAPWPLSNPALLFEFFPEVFLFLSLICGLRSPLSLKLPEGQALAVQFTALSPASDTVPAIGGCSLQICWMNGLISS